MSAPKAIVFDIETGPLPAPQIEALYTPLADEEVKIGNLKDPLKIAAKIEEAKADHRAAFFDRAALSAVTGRVLAIGYANASADDLPRVHAPDSEKEILEEFWNAYKANRGAQWVGFNVCRFDLPFIIRRSWALGIPVPSEIRAGRYWHAGIIDLRDVWQLGDREAHGNLDTIAKLFGVGAKTGDGAHFADLLKKNREAALEYLRNDVAMTRAVYRRMNIGWAY